MCAASGTLAHSIRGLRLRYRTAGLGDRFAHALDQLVRGERLAEVTLHFGVQARALFMLNSSCPAMLALS